MTPKDAIAVAKRARKLLRAGRITHRQLVLIDCLLWSCRSRTGSIVVSYSALQRLCHVARATVAEALRVLERLGVLSRIKRRIRVGWRSLVATSRYVLHVPGTEFSGRSGIQCDRIETLCVPVPGVDVAAAQAALAGRRAVVEARLAMR